MKRDFDGVFKFALILRFGNTNRRTEMHGLHEERIPQLFHVCTIRIGIAHPLVFGKPYIRNDRHVGGGNDLFRQYFVHRDGRSEDIAADKRYVCHAQKSHEGAIFAVGAVHSGKHDIDRNAFIKHARPANLQSVFEGERDRFPRCHVLLPVGLLEETEIVHSLVAVPLPFFGNVDRPHVELSARDQGIDDRNVRGDDRDVVLGAFSSENDGDRFHTSIVRYAY